MASDDQQDLFGEPVAPVKATPKRVPRARATKSDARPFRLLHTADWHLGKTLRDLSREDEHDHFLDFLLDYLETERIDALIIAGDVFDSANPPQSALGRYYRFLAAVHARTECAIVVVAGNHDSPGLIDAPRELLGVLNVHVIGVLPRDPHEAIIPLPSAENPRVFIAGVPFLRDRDVRTGKSGQSAEDIRKDLAEGIRARYAEIAEATADSSVPIIATGHLTVAGAAVSDSERDIHIGGLGNIDASIFPDRFDYVALGHLHRPQSAGPKENPGRIRYSGSPIPLSFSEWKDRKELRLITIDSNGPLVETESVPIPTARHLVQLSCSRANLRQTLTDFAPPTAPFPAWVEIVVDGATAGEDIMEQIREIESRDDYEILKVSSTLASSVASLSADDALDEDSQSILDDHQEVFRLRLAMEEGLSDEDRSAVEGTFLELLALHEEQEREGKEAVS